LCKPSVCTDKKPPQGGFFSSAGCSSRLLRSLRFSCLRTQPFGAPALRLGHHQSVMIQAHHPWRGKAMDDGNP
ncbi:hypothetical protein, partial [Delftia sp. 13_1_20CM_4_67_18]|uniref:hypothetical protein n=1 Tax=Delftia sp. 13_1_20CM_4_67_18 TaxID=1805105 RepID=UPI002587A6B8